MKTTSLLINTHEIECLKSFILENSLKNIEVTSEYELLRIKDDDIDIVVYKSGKLVHNGSEASKKVIDLILKKEDKYDYILGSDETGKGEWYGPLVVAATALKPEEIIELRKLGVKDSKTIKKTSLLKLAKDIIKMNFERHSIILPPKTYNKLYSEFQKEGKTLNDMMAWAHSKVIQQLLEKIEFKKAKIIIDKFDYEKTEYRLRSIDQAKLEIIQKSGAESETPVAAASIIAKFLFEMEVTKLNSKYHIDLSKSKPKYIKANILPRVAKIHFKNVNKFVH
jgi:ribonuclease HIII